MDGSIYSDKALEQAISMARICGSTLFAITVIDVYLGSLAHRFWSDERLTKKAGEIL
jgi:hypothetical protein